MNPDTTPTPLCDQVRFEALYGASLRRECIPLAIGEKLERELAEKTNEANNWHQHYRDERDKAQKLKQAFIENEKEVERLRKYVEKLEVYSPENDWSQPEWRKLVGSKEENEDPDTLFSLYQFRLAPAPEETQDGATMSEWYGGFSKIESTEPVIQYSRITEPAWRELGPDEVIQEGDQYEARHLGWQTAGEYYLSRPVHAFRPTRFRTRRPLPTTNHKQISSKLVDEELPKCKNCGSKLQVIGSPNYCGECGKDFTEDMPLEDEIETLWEHSEHIDSLTGHMAFKALVKSLRYLRDEIQKLKEAK